MTNQKTSYDLYGVKVSKDENGFLSVSSLQDAYNKLQPEYGWGKRKVSCVMQTDNFKKVVYYVLQNAKIIDCDLSLNEYYNEINNSGVVKYLKKHGVYYTAGARKTKQSYCVDWLWRIIYHSLFLNNSLVTVPSFILEIDNYLELTSVVSDRKNSRELSFIEKFLLSCNLITDEHITQYKNKGYKYDLKISMLGKTFIIEYHEKKHINKNTINNDYEKYLNIKDSVFYIVVPYNKEAEQIQFIKEILSGEVIHEELNEIEYFRYNSLLEEKYAIAINERVFGKHLTGMRNLASSQELKKITKIEQFVSQGINMGMIKDEAQVMYSINNFAL